MRLFLLIIGFLIPVSSHAECNFRTADYLASMGNPKLINSIDVKIPKSSKFARNQIRILTSNSANIPNKHKKSFKAKITINYDFGICKYSARIRQSGDWKDHIYLVSGNPIQSLDVKLNNGNVVGATKFKLLIPKTRNGRNEILATLLLRELDFIAPETFEVSVSVNGTKTLMLFQEKAEKELLERNLRREGAIFEGDESLIWSYKNYSSFELEPLALSRLINDNWFNKGNNSQQIVLHSHKRLQKTYLDYARSFLASENRLFMQVNSPEDLLFNDYHLLLLAMGGQHALRPHNRKFYFNPIEDRFEPIYYDGNIKFSSFYYKDIVGYEYIIGAHASTNLIDRVKSLLASEALTKEYQKRIVPPSDGLFLNESMAQILANMEKLIRLSVAGKKWPTSDPVSEIYWYKNFQRDKRVQQNIVKKVVLHEASADLYLMGGSIDTISVSELSEILSKNKAQGERYVILYQGEPIEVESHLKKLNLGRNLIKMSKGVSVDVNESKKTVSFTQHNPSDWVLFLGGDYSNWKINFRGLPKMKTASTSGQRFNELGLTGCLTLYQTIINNVELNVNDGQCEDSLNLLRVKGDNVTVKITDAFADALDADFSKLDISKLSIINAGNDCFDVSGGFYSTGSARLENCSDKAISIGEMSTYSGESVFIKGADIAISSKDFSQTSVKNFKADDVSYCGEAKQKKQEFGGGDLRLESVDCTAPFSSDKESVIRLGAL